MTKKKRELILVLFILLVAAAGFFINHTLHQKPAAQLQITVDGNVTQTFDLTKDTDTMIDGVNGGTNHLIIENGTAYFSEASCPDKVCVHQGKKHLNSDTIVCLPNQMIVTITGGE